MSSINDILDRRIVANVAAPSSLLGLILAVLTVDDDGWRLVATAVTALLFGFFIGLAVRRPAPPSSLPARSSIAYQLIVADLLSALQQSARPTVDIMESVVLAGIRDAVERALNLGSGVNIVAVVWRLDPVAGNWAVLAQDGLTGPELTMRLRAGGEMSDLVAGFSPATALVSIPDALKHASPTTRADLRDLQTGGYGGAVLVPVADPSGRVAVLALISKQPDVLDEPEVSCAIGVAGILGALWTLQAP